VELLIMAANVSGSRLRAGGALLMGSAWLVLGPLLAGCQALLPRVAQPSLETRHNVALAGYVADQPFLTAEAAGRLIYVLWKNQDYAGSYEDLRAELEAGRVVDPGWKLPPDVCLDRSITGYMLARAIDLRRGVNWQLLGLGRYAWRELVYLEIVPQSGELSLMSGHEFAGCMLKAEQYLKATRPRSVETSDLGPEPAPGTIIDDEEPSDGMLDSWSAPAAPAETS
jgi:hypothetical protein